MCRSKVSRLVFSQAPLLALSALALLGLVLVSSNAASGEGGAGEESQYIGAKKCKSCHKSEEGGNQYAKWEEMKHAQAFETLGSDEAKAIAKKLGIEDAQKSDKCLKCHTTAFGVPEEQIKKGFKPEGVQCEACHGPGADHMQARFAAAAAAGDEAPAYTAPPEGEIITDPGQAACLKCHNSEGPTFERFCYYESIAKIRHLNPRHPRTAKDLAKMLVCGCGDDCCCVDGCKDGKCGVPPK